MSSSVKCSHVHANPPKGTKIECARCLREQLNGADNANAELVKEVELLQAAISRAVTERECSLSDGHEGHCVFDGAPMQPNYWKQREDCGHFSNFMMGDDHGHFHCQVCRAEAAEERERRMREALRSLKNEAKGMIEIAGYGIRDIVGNTNVTCLLRRVDEAEELLKENSK